MLIILLLTAFYLRRIEQYVITYNRFESKKRLFSKDSVKAYRIVGATIILLNSIYPTKPRLGLFILPILFMLGFISFNFSNINDYLLFIPILFTLNLTRLPHDPAGLMFLLAVLGGGGAIYY
jgi:hypothetical protein